MKNFPGAAAIEALAAIPRAGTRSWLWFGIYLCAGLLITEGLFALLYGHRDQLLDLVLWYLFPEAWHASVEDLVERLFAEKMHRILANTGLGLAMVVVSMTLFPLKEKLSASFEAAVLPDLPKGKELPLWRQGMQECKLGFLYLTLQLFSIYLGLQEHISLAVVASMIGYWYLMFAMAVDHAAPVFQRRGHSYSTIIPSLLLRLPFSTHLIGAIFALPAVFLSWLVMKYLEPAPAVLVVLAVQMIGMGLSSMAGVGLGAWLLRQEPQPLIQPPLVARIVAWLMLLVIFTWQAVFYTWLLQALHHKSQILKCEYSLVWSSITPKLRMNPDKPGEVLVILDFELDARNATPFPLRVEKLDLVVHHHKHHLAQVAIQPFALESGAHIRLPLQLESSVDPKALGQAITQPDGFRFELLAYPPLSGELRLPLNK